MSRFQPGQVWQYKTRAGDEPSRIAIAKVESHPKLGTIVHIQVSNVLVKSPFSREGTRNVISHFPYSEQALENSVTELEKEGAEPTGWEEGYRSWKSAFDESNAAIWTVPVSEAVESIARMLDQK